MGKLSRETPPPREGEPMGAFGGGGGGGRVFLEQLYFKRTQNIPIHNTTNRHVL